MENSDSQDFALPRSVWILLAVALAVKLAAASSTVNVDEAFTYFVARSPLPQVVSSSRTDGHPPGFYLLLHPVAVATHNTFVLRLPSLLFAFLSLPLIYLIGRRLGGHQAGLAGCALAGLSYNSWLTDTQIRMYGCLIFLSIFTIWAFLESFERERPPGGWAPFLLGCLLAPLFHFFGLGLVGLVMLAALMRRRWRAAGLAACGVGLGVAWIAYAASGEVSHVVPHQSPPVQGLFLTLLRWPADLCGAPVFEEWLPAALRPWVVVAAGCLFWVAVSVGVAEGLKADRARTLFLGTYFLAPTVIFFSVAALRGGKWLQHRLFVGFAPVLFIFLAIGLLKWKRYELLGLVLFLNLLVALAFPFSPRLWNQDWGPLVEFVERHQQPGDTIVFHRPYTMIGFNYYYLNGRPYVDFAVPGNLNLVLPEGEPTLRQVAVDPGHLSSDLDSSLGERVFLVLSQEEGNAVREWFGQRFGMVTGVEVPSIQTWGRNRVYLLSRWPQEQEEP